MNIRNTVIALLAAAAVSGCYSGYGYRGGSGDYYYGQPSVDYYGYGAYGGYGYPGYGYGYDYGYGYGGYGGYGYPYFDYYYPGYPYYPYFPVRPNHPRPPSNNPRPDKPGYVIPDNGVRYPSRAQRVLGGGSGSSALPDQPRQIAEPRYQSRYRQGVPQGPSGLEGGGRRSQPQAQPRFQPVAPPNSQPTAPRPQPRAVAPQPNFRPAPAPARQSAPARGSFRDRDANSEHTP